jgi:hypothetical protein
LSWLIGFKLIASHANGFYAGIGYDYESYGGSAQVTISGVTNANVNETVTSHNLSFGLGWDLPAGMFHVRPEMALLLSPAGDVSTTTTSSGSSTSNTTTVSGQTAWVVMPTITIVAGSFKP